MSDAPRVLVIQSRYYEEVADHLLAGAVAVLEAAEASFETLDVPGALESPAALAMAVRSGADYDGYVMLGCVIRGETAHYDVVVEQSARAIMDLVVRDALAVGFGILTVENREQAMRRARVDELDKGGDAARAALAMIEVRRGLAKP